MFKHILIATDGSTLSNKAVRKGAELAKSTGAAATCVTVTPDYGAILSEGYLVPTLGVQRTQYQNKSDQHARKLLDSAVALAARKGVTCSVLHTVSDRPYEAIIAAAKRSKCDLILMASHSRRGLDRLLLGSETVKVLTHSTVPVLVVR
jgi:nucleotide-binding universal stress UspA family protein